MRKDRVARIMEMEEKLETSQKAIRELSDAFERYLSVRGDYDSLCTYYLGISWRQDYEADEEGRVPSDLKRGVLSQDAVSDLMDENRELMVRILRFITRTIERSRL